MCGKGVVMVTWKCVHFKPVDFFPLASCLFRWEVTSIGNDTGI